MILYDMIWYYMIWYYIILLYYIISYYIILYHIISYYIILYHIISYYIIILYYMLTDIIYTLYILFLSLSLYILYVYIYNIHVKTWSPTKAEEAGGPVREKLYLWMLQNLKIIENNYSGWWFQPLWNILVSWDYSSQSMESHKIHVPKHSKAQVGTILPNLWKVIKLMFQSIPKHKAAILSTNPTKANLVGHESIMSVYMYIYIHIYIYIYIYIIIYIQYIIIYIYIERERGGSILISPWSYVVAQSMNPETQLPRHIPSDAMMTWWKTKARLHSARSQVLPVQQCTRHGDFEMPCDLKQRLSIALVTFAVNFQGNISITCDFSRDPESYHREDLWWSMASMASVSRHRAVLNGLKSSNFSYIPSKLAHRRIGHME